VQADRYRTRGYKLLALASHAFNPGAWPYLADRAWRRLAGNPLRCFSEQQTRALYGPHLYELETALRALGLGGAVRDPRAIHATLFEEGRRRISELRIPFRQLDIAGESDVRLIYSAALGAGARNLLETGVALGWSSLALLKAAEATNGRLVSVDLPYPFLIGSRWVGAVVPRELRSRWTLLKRADRWGIPSALRRSSTYDFIHYDSDKSPEGRRWAYPLLWQALRAGGLLISDDVGDNEVWAEFCDEVGEPIIVVRRAGALAGIARKPGPMLPERLRAVVAP